MMKGFYNILATRWVFSMAFAANTFSVTALILWMGVYGDTSTAADIAVIHAATMAIFFACSGNARNIILGISDKTDIDSLVAFRLILIIPLGLLVLVLSYPVVGEISLLVSGVLLRRIGEWLVELSLAEAERNNNYTAARSYLLGQAITFPLLLLTSLISPEVKTAGLLLWALLPLIEFGRITGFVINIDGFSLPWRRHLPQFGSTAIIGAGLYAFRLLIVAVTGKPLAGELFAAFAAGGLIGSIYAQAIGPSLELANRKGEGKRARILVYIVAACASIVGITIFIASDLIVVSGLLNKSALFWQAIGLSLTGSIAMVAAQNFRFQILQGNDDEDLFGPDVLINILVIAAVPYVYFIFGIKWIAGLYLLSGILHLIIYAAAKQQTNLSSTTTVFWQGPHIHTAIAILLIFPLFFLVSGDLFSYTGWNYNSGGKLSQLPIPTSVLACFGGIILLANFRAAHQGFLVIFLTFLLLIISAVMISPENRGAHTTRLVFVLQFILPMFGLVLGQIYAATSHAKENLSKGILLALTAIVPLHLLASWMQESTILHPHVFLFSIYQHIQYVSVILVSGFLIALTTLWNQKQFRIWLSILTLCVGIYVASSSSQLAYIEFIIGIVGFIILRWSHHQDIAAVWCVITGITSMSITLWLLPQNDLALKLFSDNFSTVYGKSVMPYPIWHYWSFYFEGLTKDLQAFFFGTPIRPDRNIYPSAYNYYLDLAYHFGVVSLLPIGVLIVITVSRVIAMRHWLFHHIEMLVLIGVIAFLLLVSNIFTVGLRQPYPGIFSFFLWGVLLTRLDSKWCHTHDSGS